MSRLTSRRHPVVQRCRALAARREGDWLLLDGEHLIAEALNAGVRLDTVLTDGRAAALVQRARAVGATVMDATAAVLEAASPVRTASGVVAIAEWPLPPSHTLLNSPEALIVGLVNVQDPGNVGGVIRSADALGATAVLVLDDSADPRGWKALRGAMGSTFRLPVATGSSADLLPPMRQAGVRIVATVAHGGIGPNPDALARPLLLLLGNEGAGLDAAALHAADVRVSLPMRDGVESLNIGVSAAILVWEAARSPRLGGGLRAGRTDRIGARA